MKAIEFIKKFGWIKSIEVIDGRNSFVDKKSGRILTSNSFLLKNGHYEHAIGDLYMGKFTDYDEMSIRNNEVNLLRLKKYTDAYELVQQYNGLFEAKELIRISLKLTDELRILAHNVALVEEVENYDDN